MNTKNKTKKAKPKRHKWGRLEEHSFEDGTYQVCETCGAIRFYGDRYAYMNSACTKK